MSRDLYVRKRRRLWVPSALAAAVLAGSGLAADATTRDAPDTNRAAASPSIVEIRSYNLRPGSRAHFHRLVVEEAAPMLRRWEIDLVAHGPSPHDETSYYVIRAFEDLDDRQRREDAFYGSAEWREGPREAILSLIESYTTIVLELDEATIEGLRAGGRVYGDGADPAAESELQ